MENLKNENNSCKKSKNSKLLKIIKKTLKELTSPKTFFQEESSLNESLNAFIQLAIELLEDELQQVPFLNLSQNQLTFPDTFSKEEYSFNENLYTLIQLDKQLLEDELQILSVSNLPLSQLSLNQIDESSDWLRINRLNIAELEKDLLKIEAEEENRQKNLELEKQSLEDELFQVDWLNLEKKFEEELLKLEKLDKQMHKLKVKDTRLLEKEIRYFQKGVPKKPKIKKPIT